MKGLLVFIFTLSMTIGSTEGSTRSSIPLNQSWKFHKGDTPQAYVLSLDDAQWKTVCLPHTWNNLDGEDGGNNYYRGPAWYRKTFLLPKNYSGKRVFVRFGAAGFVAEVYVNGKQIGQHNGGFAAFVFDITNFIHFGKENLIAVKVDNTFPSVSSKFQIPPLSADFTMDGGLYREAELIFANPIHISLTDFASPGVFITQKHVTDSMADVIIATVIKNDSPTRTSVEVKITVLDSSGKIVKQISRRVEVPSGKSLTVHQETQIKNPHLWDGKINPYLYSVVVSVYHDKSLLDRVNQPLGLRYYRVDPEKGFFLDGKPYNLHGVCLHEDLKDKGRAITNQDRRQEMKDILDIGATVIRFAHYQYGQEMYRLCDKYGIIVWTEVPLVNQIVDSKSFEDNAEQQLKELIRQNYNHPSVLFWGIFNEINNAKGPDPMTLVEKINDLAKKEDPTRLTTAASDDEDSTNFVTDVLGLNKYFGWYYDNVHDLGSYLDKWHEEHPDRAIGISEYGAGASVYQHSDDPELKTVARSHWHPEEYQTYFHEMSWKEIHSRPYIWFSTIWNMFDFASDSRDEGFQPGINDKGIITQDHFTKKDAYYWYKVNWNPSPMVHINSKMFTARDASNITVEVYSNASAVDLYVNGKSMGEQTSTDHRFFWKEVGLKFGENHVKAVAMIDGKEYFDQCWWKCDK